MKVEYVISGGVKMNMVEVLLNGALKWVSSKKMCILNWNIYTYFFKSFSL